MVINRPRACDLFTMSYVAVGLDKRLAALNESKLTRHFKQNTGNDYQVSSGIQGK